MKRLVTLVCLQMLALPQAEAAGSQDINAEAVVGNGSSPSRNASNVAIGASVVDGHVFIDGEEVSLEVTRYRSPKTGAVYLIQRHLGVVTASTIRDPGHDKTEIRASSSQGDTASSGKAVVVIGRAPQRRCTQIKVYPEGGTAFRCVLITWE